MLRETFAGGEACRKDVDARGDYVGLEAMLEGRTARAEWRQHVGCLFDHTGARVELYTCCRTVRTVPLDHTQAHRARHRDSRYADRLGVRAASHGDDRLATGLGVVYDRRAGA